MNAKSYADVFLSPCRLATRSPLEKTLADSKIAVVTSAAFYCSDQQPFDQKMKGRGLLVPGDPRSCGCADPDVTGTASIGTRGFKLYRLSLVCICEADSD